MNSKIFPNHVIIGSYNELEWKSGLGQYTFYMHKKPISPLLTDKAMSEYVIQLDIFDTVGRVLISIDILQMNFMNMIMSMLLWLDCLLDENDIPDYKFTIGNGTIIYTIEISLNYEYDITYLDTSQDNMFYDYSAEMYREFYLDVYTCTMMNMEQNTLLLRIPVSICDLYYLIDTSLTLIADIDLPAAALEEIGRMFIKIEEICMI